MSQDQDPSKTSNAYDIMAPRWSMMRTIMAGTEAMREAKEEYLPKFSAESDDDYDARLSKSVLTNLFEDAVRNAASLPFKKEVTMSDGAPEPLKLLLDDVDLKGQDLSRFANAVLQDGIVAGYSFILVDFTRTDAATNRAEERTLGARPYWVHLKADDVIAVYSDIVGGVEVITHLRYRETLVRRDGFDEVEIERVRVYEPGKFEIWEKDKVTGKWAIVEHGAMIMPGSPNPIVPIVPIICGRVEAPFVVKPIFMDLAFKQIEHWQSASDQRNILSFGRFPLLACSGAGTDEGVSTTPIGPSKLLTTSDPQGKWYYVEPSGQAIEAGQKDLEVLKDEMRLLGLQPTIGEVGSVTATARALDETRVHSAVQVLAINLEDALNQCIDLTLKWLGLEGDITVTVNRDFGISLRDSREMDALIRARVAGEITRRTFWNELKRRNVLAPEFDADDEEAALQAEMAMGVFGMGLPGYNTLVSTMNGAGDVEVPGGSAEDLRLQRESDRLSA